MVGIFDLSRLKGDLELVGFVRVFLHNGSCVAFHPDVLSPGCGAPDYDIDLLDWPLGWVSGPPDIAPEVRTLSRVCAPVIGFLHGKPEAHRDGLNPIFLEQTRIPRAGGVFSHYSFDLRTSF
ncbi:hypothetical protein B296_00005939 [Ensete ventricosum]|uniref:Uncharacterized protein n=1 Tax=Ensete ventricosum TaxID=4639 RepID=A0A427AFH8_ENSVE|nr:hypothetical protein B296_00005939 [Ensete ventricosum]